MDYTDHSINRDLAALDRLSEREDAIEAAVLRRYYIDRDCTQFAWDEPVSQYDTLFSRAADTGKEDPRDWLSDADCAIYEHGEMPEFLAMCERLPRLKAWMCANAERVINEIINQECAA